MTPHAAGARNTPSSPFTGSGHHNPRTWEGFLWTPSVYLLCYFPHNLLTCLSLVWFPCCFHTSCFLLLKALTNQVCTCLSKMRCAPFHRDTGGIPGKVGRVTSSASCLTGNSTTGVSFSTQDYTKSIQLLSHLWVRSPGFAASSRKDKMWFQKF